MGFPNWVTNFADHHQLVLNILLNYTLLLQIFSILLRKTDQSGVEMPHQRDIRILWLLLTTSNKIGLTKVFEPSGELWGEP